MANTVNLDLTSRNGELGHVLGSTKGPRLITGPVGFGKTAFAIRFFDSVFHLDAIGIQTESDSSVRWKYPMNLIQCLASDPELVDATFEGYSDNLLQVNTVLQFETVIVPVPEHNVYRRAMDLKVRDGQRGKWPSYWLDRWKTLSLMSEKQFNRYREEKIDFMRELFSEMDSVQTFIVAKHSILSGVEYLVNGWHGSPVRKSGAGKEKGRAE